MDTIKVYGPKTKEHKRLEAAAILINAEFNENYGEAEVKDVWWDFGGGIKWTTICFSEYQALNPVQHAKIVLGDLGEFSQAVGDVIHTHRRLMEMVNTIKYGGK